YHRSPLCGLSCFILVHLTLLHVHEGVLSSLGLDGGLHGLTFGCSVGVEAQALNLTSHDMEQKRHETRSSLRTEGWSDHDAARHRNAAHDDRAAIAAARPTRRANGDRRWRRLDRLGLSREVGGGLRPPARERKKIPTPSRSDLS